MNKYKYQMHAHTLPCSACSRMTPEVLMRSLYKGGYSGCVITNHFINGNTGINRHIPWNEFVREYEKDYIECKKYADIYGLDVIFGIEEGVGYGLEILCYGVTPEILYSHPELRKRDAVLWHSVMNSHGAICIQAHPFRERDYIPEPMLLPIDIIDGVEVFNADNSFENDEKAVEISEKHPNLITLSGADTHIPQTACIGGIEVSERIKSEKQLVEILTSGNYELIKGEKIWIE